MALLVLLIAVQVVNAEVNESNDPNYPSDPNVLLKTKWDAVVSVLQNKNLDQQAKENNIEKIITPVFDFPLMAKLTLGRKHWPKLTPTQREKFTSLFVEKLKDSYREKISLYMDEKINFKPPLRHKKTIRIPVELISQEKTVAMLYKFRKVDEQWKIYDVEIEGVSILLTYRSQFDDILRTGSVEDLLARLAEPPGP